MSYARLDYYRGLPDRLSLTVSGGRSSAYQVAHIVEANGGVAPGWVCNFQNTGLERPETLDFVDRLDRHFDLGLRWLEYDPSLPEKFKLVSFATAARNGEPMKALLSEIIPRRRDGTAGVRPLPNPAQRTCTANLKTKTAHRYVRSLGWPTDYAVALGYRADEPKRVERKKKLDAKTRQEGGAGIFPMFDAGAIKDDVERFWRQMPFDLELDSDFGNCDLCFMASTWKIKQRMLHMAIETQTKLRPDAVPPERIARWIAWEERVSDRPGPFRKDRPNIRELWEQVCDFNFESAVPENKKDVCRSCTD